MPLTEVPIDEDIYELVPNFQQARRKDIQALALYIDNSDFDSIQRMCHTIKGIARPYGFPTLEELARRMEAAAKNRDIGEAKALFNEMQTYFMPYMKNSDQAIQGEAPA